MRTLNNIRRITFVRINQAIELINDLNKIIDPNTEIVLKKEENNNKISLPYLSNSIDLLEKLLIDLKDKISQVQYLSEKNNECYKKYKLILEKSK